MTRAMPARAALARLALGVTLGLWGVAMLVLGGYLLSAHLLTLPVPEADAATTRALAGLRTVDPAAGPRPLLVVHVLYASCGCSQRVTRALLARGPLAGVEEHVLHVDGAAGDDALPEAGLRAAGFHLHRTTRDELLDHYRIEAAPLLAVLDERDAIRYLGGYTLRKQGPAIEDRAIIEQVRRGRAPAALPLFGCAVSRQLRRLIDPLRLRP